MFSNEMMDVCVYDFVCVLMDEEREKFAKNT